MQEQPQTVRPPRPGLARLWGGMVATAIGGVTTAVVEVGLRFPLPTGTPPEQVLLPILLLVLAVGSVSGLLGVLMTRDQDAGWLLPPVVAPILVVGMLLLTRPWMAAQGDLIEQAAKTAVQESGLAFIITQALAEELGWLLIILFPLLIVTVILDLLLLVVTAPFIILLDGDVWRAGGPLVAVFAAIVLLGGPAAFVLVGWLRDLGLRSAPPREAEDADAP
jgi:hypothetical protein